MVWKKIVQRFGMGCCPACGNVGFDYQQGADPHDDERALVECPKCGWKGSASDLALLREPKSN
jgi:hypothetical protein